MERHDKWLYPVYRHQIRCIYVLLKRAKTLYFVVKFKTCWLTTRRNCDSPTPNFQVVLFLVALSQTQMDHNQSKCWWYQSVSAGQQHQLRLLSAHHWRFAFTLNLLSLLHCYFMMNFCPKQLIFLYIVICILHFNWLLHPTHPIQQKF